MGPIITSSELKFPNGRPINATAQQLEKPLLTALIENQWPYWLLSQQLRIEPGLWNLPNTLFYNGEIEMNPASVLSAQGRHFEKWARSYARLKPSPPGQVYPFVIDVTGGHTFRETRGTSRGCSANIHYCIEAILSCVQSNPIIETSNIVVVTSYLKEVSLYHEALRFYPRLRGIRVVCPESIQGCEADFIFWDNGLSSNVQGDYSWLADRQRSFVTSTRPRSGMAVIGDSRLIYKRLHSKTDSIVTQWQLLSFST
ncbi:hypothetical protein VTL71DRAFT_7740 [Oculimacula yallundae]|uniref:DNA2/NAM7 helicase-like C-terminal domain-containing protein n=1 Tax=Oculimacula yallundae TaxID=86028 RepID=A0ABR4CVV1_9HELO